MIIKTKGTNLILTPDISRYLDGKLRSLNKFINPDDGAVVVDVEIGKTTRHHQTGEIYRAEINVHIGGKVFRAVAEASEILAAIDGMKDQILAELRQDKTKRLHLIRKSGERLKNFLRGFYRR